MRDWRRPGRRERERDKEASGRCAEENKVGRAAARGWMHREEGAVVETDEDGTLKKGEEKGRGRGRERLAEEGDGRGEQQREGGKVWGAGGGRTTNGRRGGTRERERREEHGIWGEGKRIVCASSIATHRERCGGRTSAATGEGAGVSSWSVRLERCRDAGIASHGGGQRIVPCAQSLAVRREGARVGWRGPGRERVGAGFGKPCMGGRRPRALTSRAQSRRENGDASWTSGQAVPQREAGGGTATLGAADRADSWMLRAVCPPAGPMRRAARRTNKRTDGWDRRAGRWAKRRDGQARRLPRH